MGRGGPKCWVWGAVPSTIRRKISDFSVKKKLDLFIKVHPQKNQIAPHLKAKNIKTLVFSVKKI